MTKKSVLIGINYTRLGQGVLNGCVNDVKNMKEFISQQHGFPADDEHMRVLVDETDTSPNLLPTKKNMIAAFKWLLEGVQNGDRLFVHYSGHGGQARDFDGDEKDGMDETLCPLDYPSAGQITDDDLHGLLIVPLPKGAHLTFVADCCHSGTILDLPYLYKSQADGTIKMDFSTLAREVKGSLDILTSKHKSMEKKIQAGKNLLGNFASFLGVDDNADGDNNPETKASEVVKPGIAKDGTKKGGNVILITGCKDEQTSADAFINNAASGALTYGLLRTLKSEGESITYEELLLGTRQVLQGKYTQIPQLCCGIEINMKDQFDI